MPRIKHVANCLGLGVIRHPAAELSPASIYGKEALVTVILEKWDDPVTGEPSQRNRVPFAGYSRLPQEK